jgi:hypothetical protein
MTPTLENAAKWRDNKRAFQMALADLQGTAAAVGLDLRQAEDRTEEWAYVLRAEVRSRGSWRVLASLDVGLGEQGTMLLQTSPGEARTFSRFQPRDRAFYLRRICDLVEAALPDRHTPAR